MNQLIIIGNGFDLAHGLATKYSDFVLWYVKKIWSGISTGLYEDNLVRIGNKANIQGVQVTSIDDFVTQLRFIEERGLLTANLRKSELFDSMIRPRDPQWVDIEVAYYSYLQMKLRKVIDRTKDKKYVIENEIKPYNQSFEGVKLLLHEYLLDIQNNTPFQKQADISNHFHNIMSDTKPNDTILFLIFNYTNTVEKYSDEIHKATKFINYVYIHGKLDDAHNKLIFGYGDELDEDLKLMENLNENEFLINIKSIEYLKYQNYRKLLDFMNLRKNLHLREFKVHIMGHSGGLSDRVLLNRIFEANNCREIEIYYHVNQDGTDDFTDKSIQLYRHFRQGNKAAVTEKIRSKNPNHVLVRS